MSTPIIIKCDASANNNSVVSLLDLIHFLVENTGSVALEKGASRLLDILGCGHLLIGFPSNDATEGEVVQKLSINFSAEWLNSYMGDKLWRCDTGEGPASPGCNTRFWSAICERDSEPSKKLKRLMENGSLTEGCTCLAHGHEESHWLFVSIAGGEEVRWEWVAFVLERVAPHFRSAIMRQKSEKRSQKLKKLTKREREILNWLKHGKTSWEIAVILNVTERTINFHVDNIKNKLDVANRSQAVAMAVAFQGAAMN